MHHQVGVGQAGVDLLDHMHGQDVAVGLARELVGAVAGAHGDGQGVHLGALDEIHRRLPDTHLVMHGSSSVPEELQEIINKYGGKMKPTWGVPVEEIQRGIKHGVRKINVDTDNRMAITGAIRKVFAEKPGEFDPRAYLKPAKEAMRKVCKQRYQEFGAEGWAGKIAVVPLAKMASKYAAGELNATFDATRVAAE